MGIVIGLVIAVFTTLVFAQWPANAPHPTVQPYNAWGTEAAAKQFLSVEFPAYKKSLTTMSDAQLQQAWTDALTTAANVPGGFSALNASGAELTMKLGAIRDEMNKRHPQPGPFGFAH